MNGPSPRVAWVTNDLPPHSGGIQQFVASLLSRTADASTLVLGPLAPAGREDEAVAFDGSGAWRTERARGRIIPTSATVRWLVPRLIEHRPDVIVVASLWPLGRAVPELRRRVGARVLGITHGAEAGLAAGPARGLLRAVARDVDMVTVISHHTSAAVSRVLTGARIERLSPGVDPRRFARMQHRDAAAQLRARWGVPSDALVVGCIARLVPRKGQDMLVEVWPQLRERHPDARLVIVGEGPSRRRLARRAERIDGVHVVGPVTWADLPAAYAALDVFAMPVRTRLAGLDVEGLGISLLEAQASGLPVVVGDSGGAPETVTDPRCGTVVDGRDSVRILEALHAWLTDVAGREVSSEAGPQSAEAWSWDAAASRFDDLVREVARP